MFEKDDKRRIYWLIDQYISGNITERSFCDEFYYCFDLELDYTFLSEKEYRVFSELGKVVSRFSEYDEDHKLDKNAFYTLEQLNEKVIESKDQLNSEIPN